MKVIGITGGVGAGKSTVLDYLEQNFNACILKTDDVGRLLMQKGQKGYEETLEFFGDGILDAHGEINRNMLAEIIFANPNKRMVLNSIIHPLVKRYCLDQINEKRIEGKYDYFFLESALLLDDHYDTIVDELWYISASEDERRKRLKEDRGYSDEKIDGIFASQKKEDEFKRACKVVIDSSGTVENTRAQLVKYL